MAQLHLLENYGNRRFPGLKTMELPKTSWFGHLPGDIRIEGERTFIYAPIASMLVVSVVLSFLGWLVQRFVGR